MTASKGNTLIATVTIENPPAARTPVALMATSPTTHAIATGTTMLAPIIPTNERLEPAAIATDACAVQFENQNAQVTRKPIVGPNSRSMLAWMPSPPNFENWASAKAMHMAPNPLTTQPIRALGPSGARLTGSMKMPAPMMLPTTSAVVIHMPILPSLSLAMLALPRGDAH